MSEIKFNITMDKDTIDYPQKTHEESTSFVDEESLLPGTEESRETTGFLPISHSQVNHSLEFMPLSEQQTLMQLGLKSKGADLHYELTHNNTLLIATVGNTDNAVFTVYLDQNGAYTFTLHNHLDRPMPPNLLTTWKTEEKEGSVGLFQEIKTQPQEAYHLTFQHDPSQTTHPIQVYWGEKLLHTLTNAETGKVYNFTVEGEHHNSTQLQFIGDNLDVHKAIHNVSVTSAAQIKQPIELSYCMFDQNNEMSTNQFTVNVTTTPPIQVNSQQPFDVIYEQAVYQTIIINDGHSQSAAVTTINLDSLFKNMAISNENRMVEVVQREENGNATNVYEVKISDKSQTLAPITVADVQLSFPGGDGGVSVFHKHIMIDEGSGGILPPTESHYI